MDEGKDKVLSEAEESVMRETLIDRAMLAASYLRACAAHQSENAAVRIAEIRKALERN